MNGEQRASRRKILQGAIGLAAVASTTIISRALAQQAAQQSGAQQGAARQAAPAGGNGNRPARGGNGNNSSDRVLPGTQVVLLGTRAGPGVDLKRAETATIIMVDGTPYLVDCGYGAVRNLVAADISASKINQIFFTHLHNDHTADLPALLTLQWTSGRTKPIDLYGPYGTADMVRAIVDYCKADVGIRTVDEGRKTNPADLYHGHDIEATATPLQIFKDERVTVSTAENTHYPEHSRSQMPYRSVGVRFDTKTRSVVISGDTNYSSNLVQLAKDADVFVCEIMEQSTRDRWLAQLKANPDLANHASVGRHVSETHSTPEDVGRMAAEAKVKLVVLNHQLTSAGTSAPLAPLLQAVRKYYSGEVILGQDLMMI
ncbi:MAG TPA: MBL fold metallo-hydrolase [Steroidobacteraceae bacterium]|nr:MBL fold metallo-hydrolase [Steroidobacteraceae bacterium]